MAYPDYYLVTGTTPVIPAGEEVDIDIPVGCSRAHVHSLYITPSETQSNNKFTFLKHSAISSPSAPELILYSTKDFDGPLIDPEEEIGLGPTRRDGGFVVFDLLDGDQANEAHLRIKNNDTHDQTYAYEITISEQPRFEGNKFSGLTQGTAVGEVVTAGRIVSANSGITRSDGGSDLTQDATFAQVPDSTRQLINILINGVSLGTVPRVDVKQGLRTAVTGVINGSIAEITVTAASQAVAMESLFWATKNL